jgi:hypothetical protein
VQELLQLNTPEQDALRSAAISAIEAYCRQSFDTAGAEAPRLVDGNDLGTIYLPARLAEFTGISLGGHDVDAEGYKLNETRNRLSVREAGTWGTWADRLTMEMEGGPAKVFPIGSSNIEITGVWGWTDAEYTAELAAITTAIRWDMEDQARIEANKLSGTVRTARALGLSSVSQGSLTADLSRREPGISARVKRLLAGRTPSGEKLRWPRAGGVAV